jgi:hypothetical protein
MKIGYYNKILHILILYQSPYFTINIKNEKSDLGLLWEWNWVRKRGEVPLVPAKSTGGTCRAVPGVVLNTYFLKKLNRYPSKNKQYLRPSYAWQKPHLSLRASLTDPQLGLQGSKLWPPGFNFWPPMDLQINPDNIAGGSKTCNDLLTSMGHLPAALLVSTNFLQHTLNRTTKNTLEMWWKRIQNGLMCWNMLIAWIVCF